MPTNEERRNVAARLREMHGERQGTFEPQSMSIQATNRLDDLLDCLPKRRDMFLDLADLIEPEPERTCRIEGIYSDEFAIYDHLTCGHVNLRHHHEATSYCSTCGAKVVQE